MGTRKWRDRRTSAGTATFSTVGAQNGFEPDSRGTTTLHFVRAGGHSGLYRNWRRRINTSSRFFGHICLLCKRATPFRARSLIIAVSYSGAHRQTPPAEYHICRLAWPDSFSGAHRVICSIPWSPWHPPSLTPLSSVVY